ncbi:hypothetical protein [Geobacter sulfurreducens]|uniref:hypothetical protein n=1 Tax=Geobacter sulfurreducens TaxID=35554 RepID=UPI0020B6EEB3|nr:hypothetical protein [Geobacter sulfurreducens]UTG93451.1 hypothetical protein J8622_03725 [Geobacter sulfurreducens]
MNRFRGSFEFRHEDVTNLYHLVLQRVAQQNKGTLIQFNVRVVYDDGSSVLLNSLDDFLKYTEIRPITSIQTHLSWSFLVYFEDRKSPEKQEIEVSFVTETGKIIPFYDEDVPLIFPFSKMLSDGYAAFRIKHTARTWGADIEALLSNHIKNLLHSPSPIREFCWRYSSKIGSSVGFGFFLSTLAVCFWTSSKIWQKQNELVSKFLGQKIPIEQKFDFILQSISSGLWPRYFFSVIVFIVLSAILSVVLGMWAEDTADTNKPSFVVLTKQAEKFREKVQRKYERKWLSFLASIVVSIITGVVSNIIFTHYWCAVK